MAPLILLMDDNANYRATLRDRLEKRGYHVIEASSPEEALRRVKVALPQAAIVDMHISKENGPDDRLAGLSLVQALEERGIPCIILTAYEEDGPAVRAAYEEARFPPHGYLFKSDGEQAILQKLAAVLRDAKGPAPWYRSHRIWIFAILSAFMALGLYVAITTERAQLLGVVVIGVLIEIVASMVLHYFNL